MNEIILKGQGSILLKFEGISESETKRYQDILNVLFERGIFNIKGGSLTVHFDGMGTVQKIDYNYQWRRT